MVLSQQTLDKLNRQTAYRREIEQQITGQPAIWHPVMRSLPCIYQGESTGNQMACSTCPGATRVKEFRCSVQGRCTIAREVNGLACCASCLEYRSTAPSVSSRHFTTRHLLYHLYPRANGNWRWNLEQLAQHINLFNGQRIVAVVTDATTAPFVEVRAVLDRIDNLEIMEMNNEPSLREVRTFLPLFERLASRIDPDEATLFAQSKGVTRPSTSTAGRWATALYELYMERWPRIEAVLQQHPLAGAFKKIGRGWHESVSDWHYSASWFWFRNRDLFSKPDWRRIDRFWSGIEPYPSLHFRAADAGCIFLTGKVPSLNLYDLRYWASHVDPALTEWRKEGP